MHVCFNECMNVSLSMGVYMCLCLLNKAFWASLNYGFVLAIYYTRNENGGHT